MPTDTERREVARRLRDEAAHGEMHIRDFLGALCACIETERNAYRSLLLLADLIEPSEPEDMTIGESAQIVCDFIAKNTPRVDRDALLALADEMQNQANSAFLWNLRSMDVLYLIYYARRIRKTLGVTGDAQLG